jgi:hypothetical protein
MQKKSIRARKFAAEDGNRLMVNAQNGQRHLKLFDSDQVSHPAIQGYLVSDVV